MLNKKVFSTMFLLSALLVGCSSTNDFSDDKVKNNKEKVEKHTIGELLPMVFIGESL